MEQRKKIELTIPTIDLSLLKKLKGGYNLPPAYCTDTYDPHWYADTDDGRDDEQVQIDDAIDSQHENGNNDDGVYEQWQSLSQAERDFVKAHPFVAQDFFENAKQASSRSKELFPGVDLGRNDARDAFRHAFWSALDAYDHGANLAREFGNAHENGDAIQSEDERVMDFHNNEVGFEIGEYAKEHGWDEDQIEQEVLRALEDGRLMVLK